MTIESNISKARYIADGEVKNFMVPFYFLANKNGTAQIAVYVGESDTPLTEGVDYSVSGVGKKEGGEVVFVTAPAKNTQVAIVRNVPSVQEIVFIDGEDFPAGDYEHGLDKLTMEIQELRENLSRAIVLPPTSGENPLDARNDILQARTEAVESAGKALTSEKEAAASAEEAAETLAQAVVVISETKTAAIEEFNSNATEKTDTFNSNAAAKQNEVDNTAAEVALLAADADNSAKAAEKSKQDILNDAGFQAVANDLTGANKIGYVADNFESIAESVDKATGAATTAAAAAEKATEAATNAQKTIDNATAQAISGIEAAATAKTNEFNTNAAEKQAAVDASAEAAADSATAAAQSAATAESTAEQAQVDITSAKTAAIDEFNSNAAEKTQAIEELEISATAQAERAKTEADRAEEYVNINDGVLTYSEAYPFKLNQVVVGIIDDKTGFFQSLKADNLGNPLSDKESWKELSLGDEGGINLPLFATFFSDHSFNDVSFLRADTFSWHSGSVYEAAYNELLNEYNEASTVEYPFISSATGELFKLTNTTTISGNAFSRIAFSSEPEDNVSMYYLTKEGTGSHVNTSVSKDIYAIAYKRTNKSTGAIIRGISMYSYILEQPERPTDLYSTYGEYIVLWHNTSNDTWGELSQDITGGEISNGRQYDAVVKLGKATYKTSSTFNYDFVKTDYDAEKMYSYKVGNTNEYVYLPVITNVIPVGTIAYKAIYDDALMRDSFYPYATVATSDGVTSPVLSTGETISSVSTYTQARTLFNDVDNIDGVVINYKKTAKGYKIALSDQENAIADLYATCGVAWYYILDTANLQFKLPRRTRREFLYRLEDSNKWCNVYSDGWLEQGGMSNVNNTTSASATSYLTTPRSSTFLKPFADSNYTLTHSLSNSTYAAAVYGRDDGIIKNGTTGFLECVDANLPSWFWHACGYGIKPEERPEDYLYFYIGNYAQTAIEQTAGLNAELFNEKADINLLNTASNLDFVIESWNDGALWYRKYKSGWLEQGGLYTGSFKEPAVFNLVQPFADTNYTILVNAGGSLYSYTACVMADVEKTTTTFYVESSRGSGGQIGINTLYWHACGKGV